MKKKTKKVIAIVICIFAIVLGGTYWYVSDYYHADMSVAAIENQQMTYDKDIEGYILEAQGEMKGGIIFYPGAKVDDWLMCHLCKS